MGSCYSDIYVELTVCMTTLSVSMLLDQVTRGLLWRCKVLYTFRELVVAVVLALVGLMLFVVLGLCFFMYR